MIIGMDFGTTNSGMAVYDGRTVRVLPLEPNSPNPRVLPTALYVTNEQRVLIGQTAVNTYYTQNINRPTKLRRVWIGELEIRGGDMYYVTDAYVWVDVLSPGRLFLSIKSSLRDQQYPGTVVGQYYYPLEDLIALYLHTAKIRAEQQLGYELRQVVLGRPVHFAHDAEHDQLAQARLLQAALRAGYETVYFQYEPIAAAYNYETTLSQPQNVLVFDFGGGTLDITIMRLGDRQRRQVLATGGIPVAGDVFDQKLVRAKLPKHFGEGSVYGPRHQAREVPQWIYDSFSDWQKMLELQTAENRHILQEIAHSSRRRFQIEALINLVSSSYSLRMFDVVEQAKRRLSHKRGAEIRLDGPGFEVLDFVTRTEFESIIRAEIHAIETHLADTVQASGLAAGEIDAVIRTGGSAQIPAFYEMLCRQFGEDKVHSTDTFSSVTAGLGIVAHGVAQGELDLRGYTAADVQLPPPAHQPNVSPVNLALLKQRTLLEEGALDVAVQAKRALVLLGAEGEVTAVPLSDVSSELVSGVMQAALADLDEQLLLITNAYRFMLFTPRQLLEMQQAGLTVRDQYPLGPIEMVCSLSHWQRMKEMDKLLLVMSLGLVRPYPLNVMRPNIETPIPLKFDNALLGQVVTALGADGGEELLLFTESGRAVRYGVDGLRLSGVQALNCGTDERVAAAVLAQADDAVLLVTGDGYGRFLQPTYLSEPPKPNNKGAAQIARRS
ncbi:MAG: Hsp70 family protein, partial [Anaerolineales bacterium]|nr:Hsp70 family protein [Anaerolineales bacterium]